MPKFDRHQPEIVVFCLVLGVLRGLCVPLVIICLLPLSAHHMVDLLAGAGVISTGVKQSDYSTGVGTITAQTAGAVKMRETVLLGMRYSHYSPMGFGYFYLGGELQGMFSRPEVSGDWKFTQYDSKDKITGETLQPMTASSAPSVNSVRGLFHLGVNIPTGSWLAIELGLLAGVGGSDAKYVVQSPYSQSLANGYSSGISGAGVQGAFRFGLQLFPRSPVAVSLEYRLIADGFGGLLTLFPFLQSNSTIVGSTGHVFLASVGYRFGFGAPVVPVQ